MDAGRFHAEVLILGGGPAGAAAAIVAASHGLRVILIEREARGRERPGEGLHPAVEGVLAQLGVAEGFSSAVRTRHAGVHVTWGGSPGFQPFGSDAAGAWLGFQVDRAALDELLLARAEACGGEVRRACVALWPLMEGETLVGADTDAGPIRAGLVIDATGSAAWLGRKLNLPTRKASPPLTAWYGYALGEQPGCDGSPVLTGDAGGWTWAAPVGGARRQWIRVNLDGERPPADWRPESLAGLAPEGRTRGADVSWRVSEAASGPGWLMAGDAAARLDPLSSRGVLKALMSGMMAGQTATAVLRRGAPAAALARAYQRWLEDWFAADAARLAELYAQVNAEGFGLPPAAATLSA